MTAHTPCLEDCPAGMNLPENRYNSRVKFHCFRTWHKIWYTRSVGKHLCCMNLLNEFCIITFSFFEMMSKVFFSLPSISCPFIYMYTIQTLNILPLYLHVYNPKQQDATFMKGQIFFPPFGLGFINPQVPQPISKLTQRYLFPTPQ